MNQLNHELKTTTMSPEEILFLIKRILVKLGIPSGQHRGACRSFLQLSEDVFKHES